MAKFDGFVPFRGPWVQTFMAVQLEGSFSAAAKVIGCHQSSVTRNMKELSDFVGGDLFIGGKRLTLTPLGEAFVDKAIEYMDWVESCRQLGHPYERPVRPKTLIEKIDIIRSIFST